MISTPESRKAARLARSLTNRKKWDEGQKRETAIVMKEADRKVSKIGRPTLYTDKLTTELCNELAKGKSLRTVCRQEGMPDMSTVFDWLGRYQEFAEKYTRAKQESADALAEEIMDMADDALVLIQGTDRVKAAAVAQAVRLQVETRKWLMAKMKPKRYGDKLDLTTGGQALPMPILGGVGAAFVALDAKEEQAMLTHSEPMHLLKDTVRTVRAKGKKGAKGKPTA